jgi:hypothetical protein
MSRSAGEPRLLWTAALAVAGLGTAILYDALPGINWALWTAAAGAGLAGFARRRGRLSPPVLLLSAASIGVAGAAGVTASPVILLLACGTVVFLLATQMLLASGGSPRSLTLRFAATAPLVALRIAAVESLRRVAEATQLIRSSRARAWVRGLALTLPVLLGFGLLLANADPVFASWRDAVGEFLGGWDIVPRAGFFLVLLVIVLGAYGSGSSGAAIPPATAGPEPTRWLGATERLILLSGVAALFWLFLAVQAGYFFGNLPRIPASGVTFAEYARRGFAELSVVASASGLLIVISERYGNADGRARALRGLTFAVIAAVMLLLASAFRRVWLYEEAYGFTTARLYAQVYMGAVAAGLAALSLEVAGRFEGGRLFRRAAAAVIILFVALAYWNHEAWIAGRNLDRFAATGKLDVAYLTRDLSADAIPAIGARLPSLPEPLRSEIRRAVRDRYAARRENRPRAWFEWNRASHRARQALETSFAAP